MILFYDHDNDLEWIAANKLFLNPIGLSIGQRIENIEIKRYL